MSGRKSHIIELQSLRGIAASVVLIHHVTYVFDIPFSARTTIDAAINAHAAVVLFFVLSGYVLTASLLGNALSLSRVLVFYVRRIFRIYPVLLVATFLALLYATSLSTIQIPGQSDWVNMMLDYNPLTLAAVGLSFLGVPHLLAPSYTILVELIGSAVLPAMIIVIRRGLAPAIFLVVACAVLSFVAYALGGRFTLLMFLVDFALGSSLAVFRNRLKTIGLFSANSTLVAAGLGVVFARAAWSLLTTGALSPLGEDYHNPLPALVEAAFSTILIGAIVCRPAGIPLLRTRVLDHLGEVSYGLYLVHLPIVLTCAHIVSRIPVATDLFAIKVLGVILTAGPLSYALAWVMLVAVERPSIEAGRRLTQRLAQGGLAKPLFGSGRRE